MQSEGAPWTRKLGKTGLVSVILVNFNNMEFIPRLLRDLFRQTYASLEVLFFDNGSNDGSVEFVKRNFAKVRVFEMKKNIGFSGPNNEGIRRSHGEYVLALNLDIELERNFVEELVRGVERNPRIGWAAGKMLKLTPRGRSNGIDCLGHYLHRDRYAKGTAHSHAFRWADYSKCRYVFGASAAAALYRRTMLEDIALNDEYFDEDFFAYWEDVDLDWRAQLLGWECLYVPTAVGYHARGGSGLYKRPEVAGHYLANRFLLIVKNDEFKHLLQDARPFILRSLGDLRVHFKAHRAAVALAGAIFLRNLPLALAKRRTLQRRRRVSSTYIRNLIR